MLIPILGKKESSRLKKVLLDILGDSNPRVVTTDGPFKTFYYPKQALKRNIGIMFRKFGTDIYVYKEKLSMSANRSISFSTKSQTFYLGSEFEV